ncbi:CHAP domain-containing protein [Fodinicola feengrottensis]|uniref:CHAP domain-containing protein n=1 Tax=Fodinicola feengrottensis TaxID=435914 RepID=UPI0024421385|nr:CHAP domain-containing protein [Fodinicola feengrottensis]
MTGLLVSATASPAAATTSTGIASLANANVGGMACAANSLGGHSFYTSCTGNGGQPEYWCADFAKWVWANSGVADLSGLNPLARSFYTYGTSRGIVTSTPAVGDAVVFSNVKGDTSADSNGIHHVAIVTAVSGGTIETVSGDWGGQSGTEAHFASTSHVIHPQHAGVRLGGRHVQQRHGHVDRGLHSAARSCHRLTGRGLAGDGDRQWPAAFLCR